MARQTRRREGARTGRIRGRSWQVPLSVAVIAISVLVIWRLAGGILDDEGGGGSSREPDTAITAFWVDGGQALLNDWRMAAPDMIQDVAVGRDCLQGEEFTAAVCPELPDHYDTYRSTLAALIARANALDRPADSSADEWLVNLVTAWGRLDSSLATFAQLGTGGYERQPWLDQMERYRDEVVPGFDEAEFALARLLVEVDPASIGPSASGTSETDAPSGS